MLTLEVHNVMHIPLFMTLYVIDAASEEDN